MCLISFEIPHPIRLMSKLGYTPGRAAAKQYDEHNEVRLLSSELWNIAYYNLDIQKVTAKR